MECGQRAQNNQKITTMAAQEQQTRVYNHNKQQKQQVSKQSKTLN